MRAMTSLPCSRDGWEALVERNERQIRQQGQTEGCITQELMACKPEQTVPLDPQKVLYIMGKVLEIRRQNVAMSKTPQTRIIRDLASLMLGVAGESVSVVKRSDPDRAIKLKPKDEWEIYLEFLKVLFNITDRFSALYLPLREQPNFMDSLEDSVADQLKTAMEPIIGDGGDPMEIVLSVGRTVAESRQIYESYRFNVVEEHKEKEACFAVLGERIADAMGVSKTGEVPAAAILCITAVVPAMKSLFEDLTQSKETALSPRNLIICLCP